MNLLPLDEFYKSLPKKRMGAGVLLLNNQGELLIVKPNYKDTWLLPGGVVDENESPKQAVIREIKEEIGLDVFNPDLLVIDYVKAEGERTESLQFIFNGGRLTSEQISKINIQLAELVEFKFISPNDINLYLDPRSSNRAQTALDAMNKNQMVYLES